nr:DUF6088 family protein [Bradyrhizobium tropiciagri]
MRCRRSWPFGLAERQKFRARGESVSRSGRNPLWDESSVGRKAVEETKARSGEIISSEDAAAANKLGLTRQLTVRLVYLTSGACELHLGKQVVEFKHAPRRQLTMAKPSCR